MAKIRLNPLSDKEIEIKHNKDDKISDIVDRLKTDKNLPDEVNSFLKVMVNGYEIDQKMWPYTRAKYGTEILICVTPKGGDFGQTLAIVATVAVAVFAPQIAGAALGSGVFTASGGLTTLGAFASAAVTIGGTLLVQALIPPPVPGSGQIAGSVQNFQDSQMYSLTGQSNAIRKYGNVPRVYGQHRMFPLVVANPYTETEPDESGDLVQFLYAIYDVGFGPNIIKEMRIGDTPIENFEDITYRFVDPNRPSTDEGPWDTELYSSFTIYKGDVEQDDIGITLDGDRINSASLDTEEYQVIRSASPEVNNDDQEITLNFAFPNGLNSLAPNGTRGEATVESTLSFAVEGTEDWIPFNDRAFVSSFEVKGGQANSPYSESIDYPSFTFLRQNNNSTDFVAIAQNNAVVAKVIYSQKVSNSVYAISDPLVKNTLLGVSDNDIVLDENDIYFVKVGLPKGTSSFWSEQIFSVGTDLYARGVRVSFISNRSQVGGFENVYLYNLSEPLNQDVVFWEGYRVYFTDNRQNPFFGSVTGYSFLRNGFTESPFALFPFSFSVGVDDIFTSKVPDAGAISVTGNTSSPLFFSVKFKPKQKNQYKIRFERFRSTSEYDFQVTDSLVFTNLITRFDRSPVNTDKRHTFIEIKIRATNQLNGAIQNLSVISSSVLDTYNGTSWIKQETANPAWVFADLMTGQVNKRAISKNRLDTDSLLEWANFCEENVTIPSVSNLPTPRFECNFILDFDTTVQSIINQITGAAQASMNIIDGKYGVLIDRRKNTPVQIFTPRNSYGFTSSRNYSDLPDAIKVRYIDINANWETQEAIVYNDGFDENNAVIFDEVSSFACTNYEQAWRFGKFMFLQAALRQETISISTDFEGLVCTRGDFVQITQDVMRVGGTPARVKSVSTNRVTIDNDFVTESGVSYGYVFRDSLGNVLNGTLDIVTPDTADFTGPIPEVGDLVVWGEVDNVVYDCLVKEISINDDQSVDLVLVEKADAIYDYEDNPLLPVYDPKITGNADTTISAPNLITFIEIVDNTFDCDGNAYVYYIDVNWNVPTGSVYDQFEVYVNSGSGFDLASITKSSSLRYIVNENNLGNEHTFKVLAVAANGAKKDLGEAISVSATPVLKTTPPSNVESVDLNITNEVLQISWTRVDDCDILEYLIRYNPTLNGTWEESIPLARQNRKNSTISVQARTGTYLIKAVDFNGNESAIAAKAITTIPNLFNLNIIEETNDFPLLPGSVDRVQKVNGSLLLQEINNGSPTITEFYNEGYYYYSEFLDLGEIYTVRLQSLIQAEGFTEDDIMSNWISLDQVGFLSNSRQSEWDVRTEVRYTDTFNVMAEWPSLDVIDPLSEGEQDNWTEWKDFTNGDFTGRIFQFRLKLISNKESVTPRVISGVIRADMPDRIFSLENEIIPIGGKTINIDPEFKGPDPLNIQISQDNAQSGDYYLITNRTMGSFDIEFFDRDNNSVSRQIDISVKGYGRKNDIVI